MASRSLKEWVEKSYKILGLKENPFLGYDFQSLGKLEFQLSHEWVKLRTNFKNPENISLLDNHLILSRLWVMAGYEFVRQVKIYDKRQEVKEVYELFRRVRIPMVKYDVPRNKNGLPVHHNDFGLVYFALNPETLDVGWVVAPDIFISRNELAYALYNLY